jgi:hypothetical protein
MRSGQLLKCGQKLSSLFRGETTLELEIARATKQNRISESRRLTRLDTVKQLFHAFIGRMEAYDLRNQIGLVLFGSEATCACEITPFFEPFKKEVEAAHACGDTALYDALDLARGKLDEFSVRFPNCRKRILCLSDGADNKSDVSAVDVTIALQRSKVICDSIFIGIEDEESMLKAISVATGGYRFRPDTLKEALHLNELETVLSTAEREARQAREISASYGFTQQCFNKVFLDLLCLYSHALIGTSLCDFRTHIESTFCNPHVVILLKQRSSSSSSSSISLMMMRLLPREDRSHCSLKE